MSEPLEPPAEQPEPPRGDPGEEPDRIVPDEPVHEPDDSPTEGEPARRDPTPREPPQRDPPAGPRRYVDPL